jgi:hypothetical protein
MFPKNNSMKKIIYFILPFALLSCVDKTQFEIPKATAISPVDETETNDTIITQNTSGYWEDGNIVTKFYCPDAIMFFPEVDIRSWYKIPVVNGRLPTKKETVTGRSIHTYKGNKNPDVKALNITLPKLAYRKNAAPKMRYDPIHNKIVEGPEIVIVIQMVQTKKDTLVGYRFLTGGCGGALLREFQFLTDKEVKEVSGDH